MKNRNIGFSPLGDINGCNKINGALGPVGPICVKRQIIICANIRQDSSLTTMIKCVFFITILNLNLTLLNCYQAH